MREGKTSGQGPSDLQTKLALTRISRWHGLSDDSITLVRSELMTSLGLADCAPSNQQPAQSTTHSPVATSQDDETMLNTQMRHLVTAGAPWHVIFSVLWSDYQSQPTLAKAARILETAFVEASPSETLEVFSKLMSTGQKGFYWYLHPKLRDFIIEHAPEQHLDQLYWTIAKERDDTRLSGIEMTYIFLRVATTSDKTAAWMYFRRHQERILGSFSRSRHFGMTREQLIFRAGELALGLGHSADARDLFQALPSGTDEREAALQLMLRFESTTIDRDRNSYYVRIQSTASWEERLAIISSFCDTTRSLGGNKDLNRSALDSILKALLKWVPKNTEAWRSAGDLIVRNRDLLNLLPSIFQPLLDQAIIFHGPDIDAALWHGAQKMRPQNNNEALIYGVALLHQYVTNPRFGEHILWEAHAVFRSLESSPNNLPYTWRELIKAARQWINDSTILVERDRKRAAAALRLAAEGAFASQSTVESYLGHCTSIPESLLIEISKNALVSQNSEFALNLLTRTGLKRPFTNRQLFEMWNLATQCNSPDLAWRIATVLAAREALPEVIKSTWIISGEHRSLYLPLNITGADLDTALIEMSNAGRKLIMALCAVGARMNELVVISDPSSQTCAAMTGSSPGEHAISSALKASTTIPKSPKSVAEISGIHAIPDNATPFARAIITSPWLFAVRLLAERLSIPSWGWNIELLQQTAKTVLPLIGRDPTGKSSPKLNKWLGTLTSGERSAWNDLITCTQESHPDILSLELVKFVCRLGVILYPGHLNALKTVQELRPSLEIIRDLEWFIVSDALTSARKRHGASTRVAVPENLKNSKK